MEEDQEEKENFRFHAKGGVGGEMMFGSRNVRWCKDNESGHAKHASKTRGALARVAVARYKILFEISINKNYNFAV